MMRILAKCLVLAAAVSVIVLVGGITNRVLAVTDTATQTVTITFSEIAEIAVSGDPGTLTIVAPAVPGDLPADQTDASTTMAWTCNVGAGLTRKITGSIDALFSGIDLYGTVSAPGGAGGTSAGELRFTAASTDYDFVTAIGNCNVSGRTITYRADVTAMVAPYTNTSRTVTWTLTEDA